MEIKITDYMPAISELSPETVKDVRDRLVTYLKTNEAFQDIDTRPDSVMGDLIISPLAHLVTALELGMNRITSDIDIANVSQGTIYNCDFVKQYLNNFGEGQVYEYPSTGIIQLTYSSPNTKVLDYGTKFIFNADSGKYIYELIDVENNILLKSPYEDIDLNNPNERRLIKVSEGKYIINLAVKGPAGVGVNADTVPSTDIPHTSLIGAKALGDFDRGTLPENVMELALKIQKTYYSSTLNNRLGAVSFLLQTFPELRGVSAVISGDLEMSRNRENVLGVKEGAIDLYIKSRSRYLVSEQELQMVFDSDRDLWVGAVDTVEPAVYIDGVFRTNSDAKSLVNNIFGKSLNHKLCPGESCAYSKYESLGFEVKEGVTADDVTPSNLVNGSDNSEVLTTGVELSVLGTYKGSPFNKEYKRDLRLLFLDTFIDPTDGVTKLRALIKDNKFNTLSKEVIFVQNTDRSARSVIDNAEDFSKFLPGIDIILENKSGTFGQAMLSLVSTSAGITCTGRGGTFLVRYRYDPNYSLVDRTMSDKDVQPVNTSVLTKSFVTCVVNELHVDYKKKTAQNVDLIKAKEEIVNYINNLVYPHTYEEFTIAEILLYYGAEGVHKVRQRGQFFKTLATKYALTADDTVITDVENFYTDSLEPPDNVPGIGNRNVNFILDANNVTFNAIQL